MMIKTGDQLPDTDVFTLTENGPMKVRLYDMLTGQTQVLVGVPGAFTPTCHEAHIPDVIANIQTLKEKGIDQIAIISVNDPFVMSAWKAASKDSEQIDFIADSTANFANQTGLTIDASAVGLNTRLKRFIMLIKNGMIQELIVEDNPGQALQSTATELLKRLQS